MASKRDAPVARLIRSPEDAERAACDWLQYWGHREARVVGGVGDGGVDVESAAFVVQVKASVAAIGRPALQQIHGVAVHRRKDALFFSLGGYTRQATEWADEAGIGLFEFDLQGQPEPLNRAAISLLADAGAGAHSAFPDAEHLSSIDECSEWLQARHRTGARAALVVAPEADWPAIEEEVSYLTDWVPRSISDTGYEIAELIEDISVDSRRRTTLILKGVEHIHDQGTIGLMRQAITDGLVRIQTASGSNRRIVVLSMSNTFMLGLTERAGGISQQLADVFEDKAVLAESSERTLE